MNNLVYNTCWEDPRIDKQALRLGSDDDVLVITSAGCNALSYALDAPRSVHAVDVNYRQNALLELKIAGIRELDFETFFQLFGRGRYSGVTALYRQRLRGRAGGRSHRDLAASSPHTALRLRVCARGQSLRARQQRAGTDGIVAGRVRRRRRLRVGDPQRAARAENERNVTVLITRTGSLYTREPFLCVELREKRGAKRKNLIPANRNLSSIELDKFRFEGVDACACCKFFVNIPRILRMVA